MVLYLILGFVILGFYYLTLSFRRGKTTRLPTKGGHITNSLGSTLRNKRNAIIDFASSILGRFLVFLSGLVAIVSFVSDWVQISLFGVIPIYSFTGFALGLFAVLLIWIYPVYRCIKKQDLGLYPSILTLILVFTILPAISIGINGKTFWPLVVDSSLGIVILFAAGALLTTGMIIYELPHLMSTKVAKVVPTLPVNEDPLISNLYGFNQSSPQEKSSWILTVIPWLIVILIMLLLIRLMGFQGAVCGTVALLYFWLEPKVGKWLAIFISVGLVVSIFLLMTTWLSKS